MGARSVPQDAAGGRPLSSHERVTETGAMLYDISAPIDSRLPVWPGDLPFRREITQALGAGDPVNGSAIHTTVHIGTHADAFAHTVAGAATIEQMPLETYIGRCQVLHVDVAPKTAIRPADLRAPIRAPRLLLATGTCRDDGRFVEDFAALAPELVDALEAAGVRLVGIDTPSVDLYAAADLPVHHRLAGAGIAGLENLRLERVPPGEYELIALPLRIVGCDASPVRAVLRTM